MKMATHTAVATVALLLAGRAAPFGHAATSTNDYYQQVLGLLDPGNADPRVTAERFSGEGSGELCGVKTGMTAAQAVARWGKPRQLGSASRDYAELRYGEVFTTTSGGAPFRLNPISVLFRHDTVSVIRVTRGAAVDGARFAGEIHPVPVPAAQGYGEMLRDLFTEKTPDIQLTNSVISIAELKGGEIGGIRLGMTMTDVVQRLGKPICFCFFSAKRARLYYGRYLLGFQGDRLSRIDVDVYEDHAGLRFDGGLTGKDSVSAFAKALEVLPEEVSASESSTLCCTYGTNLLQFGFDADVATPEAGAARGTPELRRISLHYYGPEEVLHEIGEKFLDAVSRATGLDREKVRSLNLAGDLAAAEKALEEAVGKPLTEDQRDRVKAALEIRMRAVREEIETLE